ncbi:MAG TPA: O-antigen ligase family protein [Xanthobacteraceae bacterium]|jgi:O-antigen ligase|nr:O-antigen ligase family protein [Xanthobacteraceae bacterium]
MTFDMRTLQRVAGWLAVAVVVSLPWSTSASVILIVLWLLTVLPTLAVKDIRRELLTAAGGLPVLLWLLAAIGMLWADVPWAERIDGLGGFHRLLAIPLLLTQFRRSPCGSCACYGFLISATVMLALSWLYTLFPSWAFAHVPLFGAHVKAYGVPAKDYILQSGIFLICALGLIGAACERWREVRWRTIAALLCLAACFLANIAFVTVSRTTVVVAPLLAIVLGYRYSGGRGAALAGIVAAALTAAALNASPYFHVRVMHSFTELRTYENSDAANSTGLHMEYLKKSAAIVEAAPVIGHGTGTIAEQFRLMASGDAGSASAVATVNPHSQIFAVAIELGVLGAAVLLAMWAAHVLLFRGAGLMAWIGTIVVVQNFLSSLVNSHLFDFGQGWLYVFGVGIIGGTVLRDTSSEPTASSGVTP